MSQKDAISKMGSRVKRWRLRWVRSVMQNSADIEGEYRYKILTITNLPQKSAA